MRAVSQSFDFFEMIFAPNVISPSRDGVRLVHCWKGVVSIALWWVRLYNHTTCLRASLQNRTWRPAEYRRHRVLSFSVRCGRLAIPFWLDESGSVVLMRYLWLLAISWHSVDPASLVPLSVLMVWCNWCCRSCLMSSSGRCWIQRFYFVFAHIILYCFLCHIYDFFSYICCVTFAISSVLYTQLVVCQVIVVFHFRLLNRTYGRIC